MLGQIFIVVNKKAPALARGLGWQLVTPEAKEDQASNGQ